MVSTLKHDKLLSNFASNCNLLRHYNAVDGQFADAFAGGVVGARQQFILKVRRCSLTRNFRS